MLTPFLSFVVMKIWLVFHVSISGILVGLYVIQKEEKCMV
jgi:hypothetical protein